MKPEFKLGALLVCAVLLWGGIFFVACSHSPKDRVKDVAMKALEASVERPGTIKVIAVSKVDSVFGREYITQEEKMAVSMAMMKINEKVMAATDGFENFDIDNKEVAEMMERQMAVASVLRSVMPYGDIVDHAAMGGEFSGWKVKIEYEALSMSGTSYRSEYWFILDKDATCVIKSFEIPLI